MYFWLPPDFGGGPGPPRPPPLATPLTQNQHEQRGRVKKQAISNATLYSLFRDGRIIPPARFSFKSHSGPCFCVSVSLVFFCKPSLHQLHVPGIPVVSFHGQNDLRTY